MNGTLENICGDIEKSQKQLKSLQNELNHLDTDGNQSNRPDQVGFDVGSDIQPGSVDTGTDSNKFLDGQIKHKIGKTKFEPINEE